MSLTCKRVQRAVQDAQEEERGTLARVYWRRPPSLATNIHKDTGGHSISVCLCARMPLLLVLVLIVTEPLPSAMCSHVCVGSMKWETECARMALLSYDHSKAPIP